MLGTSPDMEERGEKRHTQTCVHSRKVCFVAGKICIQSRAGLQGVPNFWRNGAVCIIFPKGQIENGLHACSILMIRKREEYVDRDSAKLLDSEREVACRGPLPRFSTI